MPIEGSLGIEPMCRLAAVSRAGFYRFLAERHPHQQDMEVRAAIQQIVVDHRRRYGYRRVAAELRRQGMVVNRKKVQRLMEEDNLLAVQPKAFVTTTESRHELEVCLNLARRLKLTGINQLWVADITYIRLRQQFVYLALVLDAFSRRVVGWELSTRLGAPMAVAALNKAILERQPPPGLVHHSDRGVQYASDAYVRILQQQQMIPSMSRPANPYDNAFCESFIKTLKREEIYAGCYQDIDDLRGHMEEFIDRYYNRLRLHSALGYRTPEEFEASTAPAAASPGPRMSFFRHGEIYPPDVRIKAGSGLAAPLPALIGTDESPVGYSLAGCSPAEPASASPTGAECESAQLK
jgi:transposase InsO family protein